MSKFRYFHYDGLKVAKDMIVTVSKTFTHLEAGAVHNRAYGNGKKAEFKLGWSILFSSFIMLFSLISYAFMYWAVGVDKVFKYLHVGIQWLLGGVSALVNLVILSPVILFVVILTKPSTGEHRKYTDFFVKKD